MREYSIGALGAATGTNVATIRYYEKIGLLPEPGRTAGNQRRYGEAHLKRLMFIRHARDFGFSQDMIRELLALADDPDRSCADVDRIAREHAAAVKQRIASLTALLDELECVIEQCRVQTVSQCRIIEALADQAPLPDHVSSRAGVAMRGAKRA